MNILAFSGGKDSTALALRWHELGEPAVLLFTPTGDELPELAAHIQRVLEHTGFELVTPPCKHDLFTLIDEWQALPNWRQRWCTRALKIEPCVAWMTRLNATWHPPLTEHRLLVGLRADEEARKGLYSDQIRTCFPMQDWGWDLERVHGYLRNRGVQVPERTDCSLCFFQRLPEWYELWEKHPDRYQRGVELEQQTGHTFRSEGRDSWPAALAEMRELFERGRKPIGIADRDQLNLFDDDEPRRCRVCSL